MKNYLKVFFISRYFRSYFVKEISKQVLIKNLRKSHLSVDAHNSVLTLSLASDVISITDMCRGGDRSEACYGQLLRYSIHRCSPGTGPIDFPRLGN